MKPTSCQGCPLFNAQGPVWGTGSSTARLIILGQNPGPEEIERNAPFVGGSGRVLDRALGTAMVSRTQNFVTNVVKCYVPPGEPVPKGAVEHCRPLLNRELDNTPGATTILTLGAEAFDSIAAPKKFHMLHDRKQSRKSNNYWLRGCPLNVKVGTRQFTVIPTLHPSFVMRTGFITAPVMEADIAKAGRFERSEAQITEVSYNYNPTTQEITEYIDLIQHTGEGGLDIETPESSGTDEDELSEGGYLPVGLIGLSALRNHAMGVQPDQFDLLDPLFNQRPSGLALPVLWAYNAGFDFHHLSRIYQLDGVRQADAMILFHLLRPEMARKDLGTCMSFYTNIPFHKNLMDTDPELYNALDTCGVLEAGQEMLKEVRAKDALRFKRFPWANQSLETLFFDKMMPIIPIIGEWGWRGMPYDVEKSEQQELSCLLALAKYEEWWGANVPLFSWSSPKQLIELFETLGIKVPNKKRVHAKTKAVYYSKSVDDEFLETLSKSGNSTAGLVQTMRSLRKAGDFLNIHNPKTNRVTCRAKPHGQVGGRIQTVDVNLQQIPEEIAGTSPRDCIVAEDPRFDLVFSADYSQIEFWIYAWYSKCRRALEIKESGEYLYAAFYEDIWNEPFFLRGKPRQKQFRDHANTPPWKLLVAKSWPLGFTYGRGVPDPSDQGLPISRDVAKRIHTKFHRDYPEFRVFHDSLKLAATKHGYLQTVFGRLRRFPNPDGQHNEILAFPGQSTAVDVLIQNALTPLGQTLEAKFGERSHVYAGVHDSLLMNINCERNGKFSLDKAQEAYEYVRTCFETPIEQMGGYILPCEPKLGPSWGEGLLWDKFLAKYTSSTV